MIVKGFGRKEINLTGERQAHDKGVYPEPVPTFYQTSQIDRFVLSLICFTALGSISTDRRQ
jgi:hypothetical protein